MAVIEHYIGNETLVVERCWCGLLHAVPKSLTEAMKKHRDEGREQPGIYCPLGHVWVHSGPSRVAEAEAKLARERAAHDQTRATLHAINVELEKTSTTHQRLRKRVKNGICPCCKRTVSQMARHIADKHPDYAGKAG